MLITSFSAGELSKKLYGRIDLPIYAQGASKLENFSIIPTGGITRRRGTERLGKLKEAARLIPFIVNNSTSFVLEIGPGYIHIWKNGEKVLSGGSPLEFASTLGIPLYASLSEIREIQYSQTHKEIFLVHRNYAPYSLEWTGGSIFSLTKLSFTGNAGEVPFASTGNYPGCIAFFQGRLFLGSTALEPQKVWASIPFDYTNFTQFETVITINTKLKNPDLHVFSANSTAGVSQLSLVSQDLTNVTDAYKYYVTGNGIPVGTKVLTITASTITLSAPATNSLTDGTFSIQLWKNAGTPDAGDYEDLELSNDVTSASSAFYFEIASDKNDAIKWMAPHQDLIIGTESSEWIIPSGITAINLQAIMNSRHGSQSIQATVVGPSTIFFQQGGRALKEYFYQSEAEAYKAVNLAAWADQILEEAAAVDFDYTNVPYSQIIVTRSDGVVCILLYEKDSGVLGWYRVKLAHGKVISTATTPSLSGSDCIYFAVESDGFWYMDRLSDEKTVYLDGFAEGKLTDGYSPTARLYNTRTKMICDAFSEPVGFSIPADLLYIGYPYESVMESLPVIKDVANAIKRITSLTLRFIDSCLPAVSAAESSEETPVEVEPFSGVIKIPLPGSYDRDVFFKIRAHKCEGCTVLAVYADVV